MNKICTSLEQSKKLIELGLDANTADMCYRIVAYNPNDTHVYQPYCFVGTLESDIPAWSLSALLDVLPLEIETHKQTDGHKIYYYVESYIKRMGKDIYLSTERHENLVDACVEIILNLHGQKLL